MRTTRPISISLTSGIYKLLQIIAHGNRKSISAELRERFLTWAMENVLIETVDFFERPEKLLINGMIYDPHTHGSGRTEIKMDLGDAEKLFIEVLSNG
jgi:hypothetical protein